MPVDMMFPASDEYAFLRTSEDGCLCYYRFAYGTAHVHVQVHITDAMHLLYSDPCLDIHLDPDNRILQVNWKGYLSLNSGIEGCRHIMELMEEHQAYCILNDNTEARGLWMEAAEWAARVWFPRMRQAGMQHFAWVYSPAKFSQISADTALASMDAGAFGVKMFHDKSEALGWLSQAA
ncbi:hypothetical protein EGT07_23105 [Herbaspirillum sp. HC18]|nr:hypothetical protein EGT07_23105 [Herbaspirillum sp. HC18]